MKLWMILILLLIATQVMAATTEPEISFHQALSEMVESHVDVKVQQTQLSAAKSQVWAARGAFLPTLSLQAQQQNSGGSYNAMGTLSQGQIYSAVANWNLFRSGSDTASLQSALYNRDYQKMLYQDTSLQAESKAAQALLNLIEDQMKVEVLKHSETNTQKFFDIARSRFEKSLLAKEEVDKIAIDVNNAEAKRADAELQFNTVRASVQSMLGHSRVKLQWPWEKKLSLDQLKGDLGGSSRTALTSRADYQAAMDSFKSEDAHSRAKFRLLFPTIDASFSESYVQAPRQSLTAWQGLVTLTIPLWNDDKDYSAYRVQEESKRAAEVRLRQLERDIDSSVHTAQENFKLAIQQYQSRLKNLEIAKHLLDQDAARFKIGRTDANELNLDLTRATEAELLSIEGVTQAHLAYMNLLHAFGKMVLQ